MIVGERVARVGAALSNIAVWSAVGVLCSEARAADGTPLPVPQESIVVSLPVFVIAIMATAGFTWTVAQWDRKRTDEVVKLKQEVQRLNKRLGEKGEP